MLHLTSCRFLLFGMIISLGSSDTVKRLIFGHHHGGILLNGATHDDTNCQDPPGNIIQFNCPSKVHTDGQVCQITCIEGYKLTGSPSTITCHKGQWSATVAKCEAIVCPAPSTTNGRISCSFKGRHTTTYKLGSVCTAHCDRGFAAVNPSFSCISDKHGAKWSAQSSCKGTKCPSPPIAAHGAYHCSSRTHGINTVCTLGCDSGYRPKFSPSSITCQSSATWSTPSSCVPTTIACPAPPGVAHGVYSCHSPHGSATHRVNAVCQLHCNQGYKPSTVKSDIKCESTGSWSPPASCHAISCPAPPKVANGVYTCNAEKHKLNDVCNLRCNHGYAPGTAHSEITCLSSSAWSVPTSCHAIACPAPPKVAHGVYSCPATHGSATHKLNDVCQLQCKQGHTPSTKDSDIRCLPTNMWSAPARCPAVACAAPPKVAHGVYSCNSSHGSGTHRLGDRCQLHCNQGYKPSAAHSDIRCLSTALWSASVSCHEIRCPAAPKVAHGSYACKSTVHKLNHVCNLRCGIGFKASSSRSDITCLSSEVWSQPASCVEIQCSPPPNVANGLYACATTINKFHDVCNLQCADGYKANRQVSNIRCLWNGTWSTPASCEEIKCPPAPTVSNGIYKCASSTVHKLNDTCHLQCSTGYKPYKQRTHIACRASGQWSTPSVCNEIKCPAPPSVTDGKYTCASSTTHKLNDVCHLQCSGGYKPSDTNSDIMCLYSSKWSAPSTCVHVEIGCNTPPFIRNGSYYCGSSVHQLNDSCMLQCDSGFRPSSASTEIYCLASDEWSTPAICEQIVCPDPKPVLYGSYVCTVSSPFRLNDVCQLHCNPGYKKTSDLMAIVCLSSSTWTSSASCEEMKCYAPPIVSHGHYKCGNSTSYKIDTVCPLQCDQGYKPSSHSHISCLDEDDWSTSGTCEEIQCHDPPKVENGQYHCSHNAVHSLDVVCHLQCNNGYRISSNYSEINCLNNGSWSSASTCKEVLCPDPPQLEHGSYVCTNQGVYKLNDACQLQCDEGFKTSLEVHAIYCQMQELWTKPATCEEKRCDGLPKVDNGNVICNSSMHLINTACLVHCDAGFKLASLSDQVFCLEDETWASVSCVAQT